MDLKRKFLSRKFWAMVALFVSGIFTCLGFEGKEEKITGLIMQASAIVTYIAGESATDVCNLKNGEVKNNGEN